MKNNHVERFNHNAQNYSTDRYPGRAECVRKVLDFLDPKADDVILDVGCGPGSQILKLSRFVRFAYGIDPAERMILQAEETAQNFPNVSFFVGSAENLPPKINQLGISKIFSNYALHHLSEDAKRQSIKNLASLLPHSGMIVLGDLMFSDDPDKHKALFEIVGYGPGCDTPSKLSILEEIFYEAGLSYSSHILNPLVAVIVGKKAKV